MIVSFKPWGHLSALNHGPGAYRVARHPGIEITTRLSEINCYPTLDRKTRFLAEFIPGEMPGFFATLRMTSEGPGVRMTDEGFDMTRFWSILHQPVRSFADARGNVAKNSRDL
jgi:hypothetical protein